MSYQLGGGGGLAGSTNYLNESAVNLSYATMVNNTLIN